MDHPPPSLATRGLPGMVASTVSGMLTSGRTSSIAAVGTAGFPPSTFGGMIAGATYATTMTAAAGAIVLTLLAVSFAFVAGGGMRPASLSAAGRGGRRGGDVEK